MTLEETERDLRLKLAALHEEYRLRTKPIIDALVRIQAMKMPPPMVIERKPE